MNYVDFFTGNRMLNAAILSWFIAQTIKVVLSLVIDKKIDFHRFIGAGGWPSSHSALVVALAASTGKIQGTSSALFAITVIFAVVVMYDAAGVRRSAGEQAKILNYIMDHWKEQTPKMFERELKELIGHTPFQVIAGAIIGLIIGLLI